jgi:hypothetical protein
MMERRNIMTDLTLHEYRDLCEEELKGMLKAEVLQILGPATSVEIPEGKTNTLSSTSGPGVSKTWGILLQFFFVPLSVTRKVLSKL